jgi:hypothetical protein
MLDSEVVQRSQTLTEEILSNMKTLTALLVGIALAGWTGAARAQAYICVNNSSGAVKAVATCTPNPCHANERCITVGGNSNSAPPLMIVDATGKTVGQSFGGDSTAIKLNGVWFNPYVTNPGDSCTIAPCTPDGGCAQSPCPGGVYGDGSGGAFYYTTADCSGTAYVFPIAPSSIFFYPALVTNFQTLYYGDPANAQAVTIQTYKQSVASDGTLSPCFGMNPFTSPMSIPTTATLPSFTPPFRIQ